MMRPGWLSSSGRGPRGRRTVPVLHSGESIRNLARHLSLTADVGDGWREPRPVRRALTD